MPGKKISRANMTRIQQIADHAYAMGAKLPAPDSTPIGKADMSLSEQAQSVYAAVSMVSQGAEYPYVEDIFDAFVIVELGEAYFKATYTRDESGAVTLAPRDQWVEVEEQWVEVAASAATKAGAAIAGEASEVYATVKALGDRTLELRVAWGWDGHRERFLQGVTDFDTENYPTPPVAYYHGFDAKGKKSPRPVYIGKTIKRENRADGHYLTAKLNNKPEADKVWSAALAGKAVVSPGTIGHLIRKEPDGTLTYWPIAEISAWDGAPDRKQAHPQSVAFPVLKALYQEAGIPLPSSLTPAHDQKPEAAGDAASAGDPSAVSVSSDEDVGRVIAAQVASMLMQLRNTGA